jgi:hypothetical protein
MQVAASVEGTHPRGKDRPKSIQLRVVLGNSLFPFVRRSFRNVVVERPKASENLRLEILHHFLFFACLGGASKKA